MNHEPTNCKNSLCSSEQQQAEGQKEKKKKQKKNQRKMLGDKKFV